MCKLNAKSCLEIRRVNKALGLDESTDIYGISYSIDIYNALMQKMHFSPFRKKMVSRHRNDLLAVFASTK